MIELNLQLLYSPQRSRNKTASSNLLFTWSVPPGNKLPSLGASQKSPHWHKLNCGWKGLVMNNKWLTYYSYHLGNSKEWEWGWPNISYYKLQYHRSYSSLPLYRVAKVWQHLSARGHSSSDTVFLILFFLHPFFFFPSFPQPPAPFLCLSQGVYNWSLPGRLRLGGGVITSWCPWWLPYTLPTYLQIISPIAWSCLLFPVGTLIDKEFLILHCKKKKKKVHPSSLHPRSGKVISWA